MLNDADCKLEEPVYLLNDSSTLPETSALEFDEKAESSEGATWTEEQAAPGTVSDLFTLVFVWSMLQASWYQFTAGHVT